MNGPRTRFAERVDRDTGTVESLQFVRSGSGCLYTWMGAPPGATSAVVVCSSLCADFSANYHRERLLGRSLLANGVAAARFHYAGEGNSDGTARDMTLDSLVADARAVLEVVVERLQLDRIALHGTRLGALVAASITNVAPIAALSLWEPVDSSDRFFAEGTRARRMSTLAQAKTGGPPPAAVPWREELQANGVLDLLGFNIFPPLVESLAGTTLDGLLGSEPPPTFVARFGTRSGAKGALRDADVASFTVEESWWFQDEHVRAGDELIDKTSSWLATATAVR